MKILWLFVVIQTALAQPGFGRSYLRNSRLCHQWNCLNTKLGLSESLPTPEEFGNVLRRLLPPGSWQGVVDDVVDTCYHNRTRRYTNTCPGQAVMHCAVEQLMENCPEEHLRKADACAPVASLAGIKNMFTQSRYENLERNILVERRPSWFVKNYFNMKCCNLPELVDVATLAECGFTSMVQYYDHNPEADSGKVLPSQWRGGPTTPANNGDSLNIVSFKDFQDGNIQVAVDPLDCCDISEFIQPSWRQECNFALGWEAQRRLVIKEDSLPTTTAAPVSTSTKSSVVRNDFVIVPNSCEESTCVFNKLNILSPTGAVDTDAFIRLLDNFTSAHPTWTSAKGRVVTTCLRKPVTEYTSPCEINKVLACTLDVLTENCPYANKTNQCNWRLPEEERVCHISSSKYRPKHRRDFCLMPALVDQSILKECSLLSIGKSEPVPSVSKPRSYRLFTSKSKCQDLTPSTSCLMTKMDVLNKYGFMDYFKMKDRIRHLTSEEQWSSLQGVYLSAFSDGPLYREHCNSPKKFLNVIDSILLTCPNAKKKNTAQCASVFERVSNTPVSDNNVTKEHNQLILNHFLHVFYPPGASPNLHPKLPKHTRKLKKTPIFHYGLLNDRNAPKVTTIDVTPVKSVKSKVDPPLILLPVYLRAPTNNLTLLRPFNENGVMRGAISFNQGLTPIYTPTSVSTPPISTLPNYYMRVPHSNLAIKPILPNMRNPFFLYNHRNFAHFSTPISTPTVSTTSVSTPQPISTTPVSRSKLIYTTPYFAKNEEKFEMIKPE